MARFVTATFTKLPDTIATRFYHTDVIGSVRAITDEVGAVVARNDYRPFGEDVASLAGDPNRFAGKQLDPETALHYFDARYYRQTWGRLTTVDPVSGTVRDPQTFNRYAYAKNNPLRFIDPDGLHPRPVSPGERPPANRGTSAKFVTCTNSPAQQQVGCFKQSSDQTTIVITTAAGGVASGGLLGGTITVLGVSMTPAAAVAVAAVAAYGVYVGVKALWNWFASDGVDLPDGGPSGQDVQKEWNDISQKGKAENVKIEEEQALRERFDRLTADANDFPASGYKGVMKVLKDGSRVGLREDSRSGGPAIDIFVRGPRGFRELKIHTPEAR